MIDFEEYERKRKYRSVISRLNSVNNKVVTLNNSLSSLEKILDRSISIDDEGYKVDSVESLKDICTSVSSTISNRIIPSLRSNI